MTLLITWCQITFCLFYIFCSASVSWWNTVSVSIYLWVQYQMVKAGARRQIAAINIPLSTAQCYDIKLQLLLTEGIFKLLPVIHSFAFKYLCLFVTNFSGNKQAKRKINPYFTCLIICTELLFLRLAAFILPTVFICSFFIYMHYNNKTNNNNIFIRTFA